MPVIDSRKFISAINDSAQAKVALFEERIAEMGKNIGKNWRLTALQAKQVYFEDVDTNIYYVADHSKTNGQVKIHNIDAIEITEGGKKPIFSESCLKLVNAIEENNQKEMGSAFDRMKAQRFSGRVVPHSGVVKCRDGVLRNITVKSGSIGEDDKNKLIAVIVESLKDKVVIEEGRVVEGYFQDGEKLKLPVSKWGSRKLVARRMRDSAANAFWSEGFQVRIKNVASLIAENKVKEAVEYISPFLLEMEEFTLLTKDQTKTLVENTLATQGIFNDKLAKDTATLFFRTNMRANKNSIVSEWKNIAKSAEHSTLAENVYILGESKNFEEDIDKFLTLIFEAISNRDVAAGALATTLQSLRDKTPKIRESHDLSSKLNGLINRLKQPNFDDASIYEAEDLIATIQEELAATDTLSNFDKIPGSEDDGFDVSDDGLETTSTAGGAPVININSPLIQIGGTSSATPEEEPDLDLGPEPEAEEEPADDDLESLLGGQDEAAQPVPTPSTPQPSGQPAQPAQPPLMQSVERRGRAIGESRPVHYEMNEDDEDEDCHEESVDPYFLRNSFGAVSSSVKDYGAPVITNERDLNRISSIMYKIATENKYTKKALAENIDNMAKASIEAVGLRIPSSKLPQAVEQCCQFFEEWKKPWLKDDEKDSDESESDEEEGVTEDQFKSPRYKKMGLKKSSIGSHLDESIRWGARQDDAVLGEFAGVKFIFDHGGSTNLEPVILSEDGAIEVPIPAKLRDSAFAAARMARGDQRPFVKWLSESIDQFAAVDDDMLNEAIATIKTSSDGSLSVEVTPDVDVNEMDDELGGEEEFGGEEFGGEQADTSMDETDEIDDEEALPDESGDGEMQPVDSVETDEDEEEAVDDGSMPNFEHESSDESSDESEDGMFEDKDITQPKSSEYTKHVKDDKRKMPEPKMPKWSDNKVDEIGPEVKKAERNGGNPPTAKKMSDE